MKRFAILLPIALAACGAEPEAEPSPEPTQVVSGPRTLVAAGFEELSLGPMIVGPQGPEVSDTATSAGGELFEIVSYVACPAPAEEDEAPPADECDPAAQDEDAVFTYVHTVTPLEGAEAPVTGFASLEPAAGFSKTMGYDRNQAEAALGENYSIVVQVDEGMLVWRIEVSDGWEAGEPITFFWQGTKPPAGPKRAYCLETGERCTPATGPFPEEDKSVDRTDGR